MRVRRRWYGFSADLLQSALRQENVVPALEVLEGLPADAKLVSSSFGFRDVTTLYLAFESAEFELVERDDWNVNEIVIKRREP